MNRAPISTRLRDEAGFTMIIAIGVLFVTGLILAAAFTIANGDVHNSQREVHVKQAYYEALAGVQAYESKLESNPNFWQTCESIESELATEEKKTETALEKANKEKEHIRYEVAPVPANKTAACSKTSPFSTMIESKGTYANTFRVRSTGYGPKESNKASRPSRSVIATFSVSGFLDYLWYTNYETEDPGLYKYNSVAEEKLAGECENKHYGEWNGHASCKKIEWNGDKIEGPFHTEDKAYVTGSWIAGRAGQEPEDPIEIKEGTYGGSEGCKGAVYNNKEKCYTTGVSMPMPPEDTSLSFYVETSGVYTGETWIKLEGNTMTVKKWEGSAWGTAKSGVALPTNGLIYVRNNGSCGIEKWKVEESDTTSEQENGVNCGTVYVSGNYEKSLTIAAEDDVVVNENVYPTGVTPGNEPTGTAVLGLIANNYVRVWHPCTSGFGGGTNSGKWENPWIYAAIMATKHSWIVDNAECGKLQGKLNVYGALTQKYRGVVYRGGHGYEKHYEYDERLATDEPPYFLAPLKAGWKVIRQVAENPG
jgi:Tfp pilus assembly protein PilX